MTRTAASDLLVVLNLDYQNKKSETSGDICVFRYLRFKFVLT